MQIRIEAHDLPGASCGPGPDFPGGHPRVHAGVQHKHKRDELLDVVPGDAPQAVWTPDCEVARNDISGPYMSGPPGGRFIYLSWITIADGGTATMFRRAKIWMDAGLDDVAIEPERHGSAGPEGAELTHRRPER